MIQCRLFASHVFVIKFDSGQLESQIAQGEDKNYEI